MKAIAFPILRRAALSLGVLLLFAACSPSDESRQPDSGDATTPKYETLHKAAEAGDLEDVKLHIQLGADVNKRDEEGYAPLQRAVAKGHTEVTEFLVAKGAKNSQVHRYGDSSSAD